MMRFGTIILIAVTSLAHSASAVVTDGQSSPYQAIVERNAFQLRPPTTVVTPPTVTPVALPKITLTGITTILGRKMVFLTMAAIKPGEPAQSFVLTEGQGVNGVAVKIIDVNAGFVSIINQGEPQTLDFEHNGEKASSPQNNSAPPPQMLPPPQLPIPGPRHMESSMTPEEQTALIEIQRVKLQQENNAIHQLLPATEMTSEPPQY